MSDISFSVVIPTFRRPKLLIRSLQSVVAQLEDADEIIVVNDDRKTEVSLDLSLIEYNNKIRIVTNQFERGPAGARNFGVSLSNCKYVMFLDDDDVMQNGYLLSLKLSLMQNSDAGYGGAQMERAKSDYSDDFWRHPKEPEIGQICKKPLDVLMGCNCGMWVKRSLFTQIGGFNEELINSEDNDLCMRLFGSGVKCLRCYGKWIYGFDHLSAEQANITSTVPIEDKLKCWWIVYLNSRYYFNPFHPIRIELLERFTRRAFRENRGRYALDKFKSAGFDPSILIAYLYTVALRVKYFRKHDKLR